MKHNLGNKKIVTEGCSKTELTEWYNNKEEINGFIGGVIINAEDLVSVLPEGFVSGTSQVDLTNLSDEENNASNEAILQDCTLWRLSNDNKTALVWLGCRDSNGNRQDHPNSAEFYLWADYFGIDNVLTKSDFYTELKTKYTLNKEYLEQLSIDDLKLWLRERKIDDKFSLRNTTTLLQSVIDYFGLGE